MNAGKTIIRIIFKTCVYDLCFHGQNSIACGAEQVFQEKAVGSGWGMGEVAMDAL
jgi:hypothetical protein